MKELTITIFETSDGKEFRSSQAAREHERELHFLRDYDTTKLFGAYEGCKIEGEAMLEWLMANETLVRKLYGLAL